MINVTAINFKNCFLNFFAVVHGLEVVDLLIVRVVWDYDEFVKFNRLSLKFTIKIEIAVEYNCDCLASVVILMGAILNLGVFANENFDWIGSVLSPQVF